jgi:hypothetical protein
MRILVSYGFPPYLKLKGAHSPGFAEAYTLLCVDFPDNPRTPTPKGGNAGGYGPTLGLGSENGALGFTQSAVAYCTSIEADEVIVNKKRKIFQVNQTENKCPLPFVKL